MSRRSDTLLICPDNWEIASFGEVAVSFQNGCGVRRSESGRPTVVLRLADVSLAGELAERDALRMVGLSEGERSKYGLKPGDLLIFRVNGSRNITGRVVTYQGPDDYAYCDHFIRARLAGDIDPTFVALQCGQGDTRRAIESGMVTTAGQNTISQGTLTTLPLWLAPAAEQKRIVAKIEELRARSRRAKEALDAVPPLLDQLRQSILAAAFRGDLTADWRARNHNVEPSDQLLTRVRLERRSRWETAELARMAARGKPPTDERWRSKYEEPSTVSDAPELHSLPPSWSWTPLETIRDGEAPMVYGIILPGDDVTNGVPYVRPVDIADDGSIDVSALKRASTEVASQYARSTLKAGDIILSIVGTIGKVAVATAALDGANITQSSIRIRPGGGTSTEFLRLVLQAPCLTRQYDQYRFGNAVQRLNVEHVRQLVIPFPPIREQEEICRRVGAALERVNILHLSTQTERLAQLESSILSKAFRGELVSQDPNDEPASALLQRLRAARESAETASAPRRPQPRPSESAGDVDEDDPTDGVVKLLQPARVAVLAKDLAGVDSDTLHDKVFDALWTLGPLEKEEAVRRVADYLRRAGHIAFERLRADGPLFGQVLDAIEAAVRVGRLDRPRRGYVRACKPDAPEYTADDWRHALVASLAAHPTDRDDALRTAAEWARDNLGLAFARLRADGQIAEGLRSALNSAIRRGEVIRHDATHISRAAALQPARLLKGRSA